MTAHRGRLLSFAATVLALLVALEAVWLTVAFVGPSPDWYLGMDFGFYRDLGARWLADGSFYLPHQLKGPYHATLLTVPGTGDTFYPPSALALFVPFSVLPAFVWWAVPIGVLLHALWRLCPAPWAWVVMLLLFVWPRSITAFLFGNTDIWMAAGVAAGFRWGWPALALTLKPTLLPLTLVGVRHRTWWYAAGIGLVSIFVAMPLWADYLSALRNVQGLDLGYSLGSLPLVMTPVVAWCGRSVGRPCDQTAEATSDGRTERAPSS